MYFTIQWLTSLGFFAIAKEPSQIKYWHSCCISSNCPKLNLEAIQTFWFRLHSYLPKSMPSWTVWLTSKDKCLTLNEESTMWRNMEWGAGIHINLWGRQIYLLWIQTLSWIVLLYYSWVWFWFPTSINASGTFSLVPFLYCFVYKCNLMFLYLPFCPSQHLSHCMAKVFHSGPEVTTCLVGSGDN